MGMVVDTQWHREQCVHQRGRISSRVLVHILRPCRGGGIGDVQVLNCLFESPYLLYVKIHLTAHLY